MHSRPSWQAHACPPWCQGDHAERDHPDDRVHRSGAIAVPVVARRTWYEGARLRREAESTDFEVALSLVDGESETWLYVGVGPTMSIEVTTESAQRLAQQITEALKSR